MNAHTPGRAIGAASVGTFIRVEKLPGTRSAAKNAVSHAAKKGRIIPVHRGLYFKGKTTRYGMTTPRPEEVAIEVLGRKGVGPAGYSAARELGLTTQMPKVTHLAVAGPLNTGIKGVSLHKRNNLERRELNRREIAILEVLRDPEHLVERGWNALVDVAKRSVSDGSVRIPPLERAVEKERNAAAVKNFEKLLGDLSVA